MKLPHRIQPVPKQPHSSTQHSKDGTLRSYPHSLQQVCQSSRCLSAGIIQKHTRNCPGHQWQESYKGHCFPRARQGAQGSRAHEAVCWEYWTNGTRQVSLHCYLHDPMGSIRKNRDYGDPKQLVNYAERGWLYRAMSGRGTHSTNHAFNGTNALL